RSRDSPAAGGGSRPAFRSALRRQEGRAPFVAGELPSGSTPSQRWRRLDGGPVDALLGRGVAGSGEGIEEDGPAELGRAPQRLEDAKVRQSFDARGLGLPFLEDAAREVEEERRELVGRGEGFDLSLVVSYERQGARIGEGEGALHLQRARRADDTEMRDRGGDLADLEGGEPSSGEAERARHRLVHPVLPGLAP